MSIASLHGNHSTTTPSHTPEKNFRTVTERKEKAEEENTRPPRPALADVLKAARILREHLLYEAGEEARQLDRLLEWFIRERLAEENGTVIDDVSDSDSEASS
ncbi:hypothetical protein JCM11251_003099 [Rhodosporidiobolus azoricus]